MYELFETVLILSLFGFVITALLLCLKPVTAKKFPAKWQYCVWIAVLLAMVIPVYKVIPKQELQKLPFVSQNQIVQQEISEADEQNTETVIIDETPVRYREVVITPQFQIRILDLIAYIWFLGVCLYVLIVITSYGIFIFRKRKGAMPLSEYSLLDDVKRELKINRHIKLRMSPDVGSPMLVGVLFPVVYLPCREISEEGMRMVLLHELTHYKRMDLPVKWFSVFVNAVHWFNPMAYLLCANVSEACEVSCDMSVTKNMTDDRQKLYMKTILALVEERLVNTVLENLYTTRMSASKRVLQSRFAKIRSENGKFSKLMALVMTVAISVIMLFATVVMASVDGLERKNGKLVLHDKTHMIDIVHIPNHLATHTDSYYMPLRETFELLGYTVIYDVSKTEYAKLIGKHTFPVYDYVYSVTFEDGTTWTHKVDEWKKQFVKNDIDRYIYGQTELTNAQMPIIEMKREDETQWCQIGSKNYSKGYAPAPVLIEGKTYIPLRAVAYYIGDDNVKWNDEKHDTYFEGTFTFHEESMTITITEK